jgi:hypothetical protein
VEFGQPELGNDPLSSGHGVVPLRRLGQLAAPECDLGTNELVRERARLAVMGQAGHGGSILKD